MVRQLGYRYPSLAEVWFKEADELVVTTCLRTDGELRLGRQ